MIRLIVKIQDTSHVVYAAGHPQFKYKTFDLLAKELEAYIAQETEGRDYANVTEICVELLDPQKSKETP